MKWGYNSEMTLKHYQLTMIYYEVEQDDEGNTEGAVYNDEFDQPLTNLVFNSMDKAIQYVKYTMLVNHEILDIDDLSKGKDKEVIIFFGVDIKHNGVMCERAIRIEQNDNIQVSKTLMNIMNIRNVIINGA